MWNSFILVLSLLMKISFTLLTFWLVIYYIHFKSRVSYNKGSTNPLTGSKSFLGKCTSSSLKYTKLQLMPKETHTHLGWIHAVTFIDRSILSLQLKKRSLWYLWLCYWPDSTHFAGKDKAQLKIHIITERIIKCFHKNLSYKDYINLWIKAGYDYTTSPHVIKK